MERFRNSQQDGLHGAVRVKMSMEASRAAWETRGEPKVREQEKVKVYRVENN